MGFVAGLVVCGWAVTPELLRGQRRGEVRLWLTNADKSALFEEPTPFLRFTKATSQEPTIENDDQQRFQSIDGSSAPATLPNVAFEAQSGKTVLIVVNDGKSKQEFHVRYHGKWFKTELNERAVGTYEW